MFPYSLKIPNNLKHFVPGLKVLIKEYDCLHASKGKNGITTIALHFKSETLRTNFIGDMRVQFPAYIGLGTRLVKTNDSRE